jgi:AraC-like DNA-binding protein
VFASVPDGRLEGRRVLPSHELSACIHHYWSLHWELRSPFTGEALPHPAARIVLEERDGACRAEVEGVCTGRIAKQRVGRGQVFGVQFRPAAFQPLFGAPMQRLTNRVVPAADVLGREVEAWARATLQEPTLEAKIARTEAFLLARLPSLPPEVERLRDLVERIAVDRALCRVEHVADALGVDVRTLQRRFRSFVGAHPKWVIQSFRLHEAAEQLRAAAPPTLAALAAALGYADQAHFAREFRLVMGRTPGSFTRS